MCRTCGIGSDVNVAGLLVEICCSGNWTVAQIHSVDSFRRDSLTHPTTSLFNAHRASHRLLTTHRSRKVSSHPPRLTATPPWPPSSNSSSIHRPRIITTISLKTKSCLLLRVSYSRLLLLSPSRLRSHTHTHRARGPQSRICPLSSSRPPSRPHLSPQLNLPLISTPITPNHSRTTPNHLLRLSLIREDRPRRVPRGTRQRMDQQARREGRDQEYS